MVNIWSFRSCSTFGLAAFLLVFHFPCPVRIKFLHLIPGGSSWSRVTHAVAPDRPTDHWNNNNNNDDNSFLFLSRSSFCCYYYSKNIRRRDASIRRSLINARTASAAYNIIINNNNFVRGKKKVCQFLSPTYVSFSFSSIPFQQQQRRSIRQRLSALMDRRRHFSCSWFQSYSTSFPSCLSSCCCLDHPTPTLSLSPGGRDSGPKGNPLE